MCEPKGPPTELWCGSVVEHSLCNDMELTSLSSTKQHQVMTMGRALVVQAVAACLQTGGGSKERNKPGTTGSCTQQEARGKSLACKVI